MYFHGNQGLYFNFPLLARGHLSKNMETCYLFVIDPNLFMHRLVGRWVVRLVRYNVAYILNIPMEFIYIISYCESRG